MIKNIKFTLTPNELTVILKRTSISLKITDKISQSYKLAKLKRKNVKRFTTELTQEELDSLLEWLSRQVNKYNTNSLQYQLNSIFGKLATKYNESL